jgi:hypothetical protein
MPCNYYQTFRRNMPPLSSGSKNKPRLLLPDSCWFLAWIILQSWKWMRHVNAKRWLVNELHGVIDHKIEDLIYAYVKIANGGCLTEKRMDMCHRNAHSFWRIWEPRRSSSARKLICNATTAHFPQDTRVNRLLLSPAAQKFCRFKQGKQHMCSFPNITSHRNSLLLFVKDLATTLKRR